MYTNNEKLVLIETVAGLTNYSHPPALRPPAPYMDSMMMDEMLLQNRSTGISPTQLKYYSAHLSGLSANPTGLSNIRGGYSEYNKGLMKLTFALNTGGVSETLLSVVGYVTHNDLERGLSENAIFTPVYSYKEHTEMTSQIGHDGLTATRTMMGLRTDYMLNDGSYSQSHGLATLRPGDIIGNVGDSLVYNDVNDQAMEEGIHNFSVINTTSTGSINNLGIICSNRKNYNPTRYAEELLGGAINAQHQLLHNAVGSNPYFGGDTYSQEMRILSEISSELLNNESKSSYDEFLNCMIELNGSGSYRGFRGWSIRDIVNMFPNFKNTIPAQGFVHMNRDMMTVVDYTEIARRFGTSHPLEVVAQELVFNLLDVLIFNDLGELTLEGSNYKHVPSEDRLSNIVIVPYNGFPISKNNRNTQYNMLRAAEQLRYQIFNKLNGRHINNMTPIQFKVRAELLGFTEVTLISPGNENTPEMSYFFSFPTYAPSPYSPIFSDVETAEQLSRGVYGNVKSFFEN